ncbi:MAG: TonB-dependent receptor [Saprospiraceae bacterium]|nr:MAG: TonB-dependent receptor [Saprospiraceae bacterium]
MRKIIFTCIFLLPFFMAFGQRTIAGRVLDDAGKEGIIGANIMLLKGSGTDLSTYVATQKGTVTDIDGNFSLEAGPEENAFSVSYIGYETQTILIGQELHFEVFLKEKSSLLSEVVVVGYGVQRKVDVTGSTSSVKGEDLARQPVLTATQALQGKAAGVQVISSGEPGRSPVVRVRGVSSAIAGTATLYVVDGVLTEDISNINTNDIVSMDILKDASATAIYGARGANGVIIITTKKGASGTMTVNYSSTVGFKNAANLVRMANSAEYANYVSQATSGNVVDPGFSTDWYSEILRNAWYQSHSISLSGGSDKARYYISGGYLEDEGIVIDNKYKRFDVRANLNWDLNKWVSAGLISSFANSNNKIANLGTAYNNAYRAAPIIKGKEDGRYGNTSVYQNVGNPILDIENNYNREKTNRLQSTGYLDIKPVSWLTLRSSIGAELLNKGSNVYNYQFENDETKFLNAGGNQRNPNSNLFAQKENALRWVWDNTATFLKQFDNHTVTLMAGTTAEKFTSEFVQAFRKDVPANKNLWYIGTGDANTSTNDGGGDQWARNAYLARLNYNYADKYLFTGTMRYDGSSRLSPKNRWGLFPSFGVGWMISSESFMANQVLIDILKLRASWGRVGNDRVPTDAFVTTVEANQNYPFGGGLAIPGSAVTQIKDPNLKWETTEELDLALEFGILKNRLTGEIGYYNKKARDLLINIKVPSVVGDADGVVLTNAASIRNSGLEMAMNWRTRISDKLSYFAGANITFNNNKVIGLNGGQPILDGGIGAAQQYTTKTDNDQEVGSFYVYQVLGVFQSDEEVLAYTGNTGLPIQPAASAGDFKYLDANNDGVIDDNDRVFVGSYQPDFYYGINLGVTIGRFDLTLDMTGVAGNKVYNGKKAFRQLASDNIERDMAYNRWTRGSGINDEPAANSGNLPASTYFVEPGDYIRINNITLSYTLPEIPGARKIYSNARIYLTGQNVFTFKEYSGFTAELPGDPTSSGIELNAYPTSRTIAAGINFTF